MPIYNKKRLMTINYKIAKILEKQFLDYEKFIFYKKKKEVSKLLNDRSHNKTKF